MKKQYQNPGSLVGFISASLATISCSHGSTVGENVSISEPLAALICPYDPKNDPTGDLCCVGTIETKCRTQYGDPWTTYLGITAFSNGLCTNGGSGAYQCTTFAFDFYKSRLQLDLGAVVNGGQVVARAKTLSFYNRELFVFTPTDQEFPRETDLLSFSEQMRTCTKDPKTNKCSSYGSWRVSYGHVVVVSGVEKNSSQTMLRVIEQNVVPTVCPSTIPPFPSYGRKLKVDSGTNYVHGFVNENDKNTDDTFVWMYEGIVRHNLAGIYDDTGWHNDGISKAFRDEYLVYKGKLGWAFDNSAKHDGTPFVHKVRDVPVQDFVNTDPENRFGTDGKTMLLYSSWNGINRASLLKEGFKCVYQSLKNAKGESMGGIELVGVPTADEHEAYVMIGDDGIGSCTESTANNPAAKRVKSYQPFERGCMWYREEDQSVHLHTNDGTKISDTDLEEISRGCNLTLVNNPPGPNCTDECTPSTQRCLDPGRAQVCGRPGPDSCTHWLTLSCGSGTVCTNGACDIPSTSSVTISSGGATATTATGGTSSRTTGAQHCVWHDRRCTSNPETYQVCVQDAYTLGTDWMDFTCDTGFSCNGSGICIRQLTTTSGGASSSGGVSSIGVQSVVVASGGSGGSMNRSSSGGSSIGGSSSLGGSSSSFGSGGVTSVSSSDLLPSGGVSSTIPSNVASTGGTNTSDLLPTDDRLLFRYEGPVVGSYLLNAWWQHPDGTNRAWGPVGECVDTNSYDRVLQCALPVESGSHGLEFQVDLPDGRHWGDLSSDPTGGNGMPIGTVTITKGDEAIPYAFVSNGTGPFYDNGYIPVVP